MLVLTLKVGEKIILDNGVTVTLVLVQPGNDHRMRQVRIGIDAPKESMILRGELFDKFTAAIEQSQKNLATWSKKP